MKNLASELRSIIDAVEPTLRAVTEPTSREPVLAGGWSSKQVLGHLIDSASNNHQRFVRAALQDSLDFPGYDQDGWQSVQGAQEAPWDVLVTLWAAYNRYLAHIIERLPAAKLDIACRIGSNQPVTLRFLAADYLRHLKHHLEQVGFRAAGAAT